MQPDEFDLSRIMPQLFDHAVESIVVVNTDERILYANQITALYGGKSIEEMLGRRLWEALPDLAGDFYEREFRRAVREQERVTIEYHYPPTDKWFEVRFYPSPDAVAIFGSEITERKVHAEAIRASEEKYRLLIDALDQGYALCEMIRDADGCPVDFRYLEINRAIKMRDGFDNYVGRTVKEIAPGLENTWAERYAEVLRTGRAIRFEQGSDYLGKVFDVFAFPVDANRFIMLFNDITARKQQEREMETLNERLRRAMQETHHRVKNNLQVIAALVEMQADDAGSSEAAEPLRRINQHVQALAVIHDQLTQNAKNDPDLSHLGTRAVLSTLLPQLQNTIGDRRIVSHIDDLLLTAEKAGSLALLVSECVSNAIKHGRGEIEVNLHREGDRARLEICDDGKGFPCGFDPRRAANTGLQLIESAGRWDLGGEVHYDNQSSGGGRVTVVFPLEPSRQG